MTMSDHVLYHQKSAVEVGQIERYVVSYSLSKRDGSDTSALAMVASIKNSLWLQIKNVSKSTYRAGYIMGPYDLYCDLRQENYDPFTRMIVSAEKPQYHNSLLPQTKFVIELTLHQLKSKYVWIVDVVSNIIFSRNSHTSYELTIGTTKNSLKSRDFVNNSDLRFNITKLTNQDLWKIPKCITEIKKPKHLIILTHGLHSNVSVDMIYIMEEIYKQQTLHSNEDLVVDGYLDNVCQTEKGVKYLGTGLAEHIINNLYDASVKKISFIGHSLGGIVQMFAIAYISIRYPWFFEKVQPTNFVTLASPLLGLGTHDPKYLKYSLSYGIMGQTGKDLGLHKGKTNDKIPLLYLISGEPFKSILKRFQRRTAYANAINDGIVPLYTSALLYLEYKEILNTLQEVKQKKDELTKLPNASLIGSVASLLTQPRPNSAYIDDPSERNNIIIHDKLYTEDDCQKLKEKYSSTILKPYLKHKIKGQEKSYPESIADRLQEGVKWRKVIVALKPDAHNNIIVRRRFTNAYGWPVVKHLVSIHFTDTAEDPPPQYEPLIIDSDQFTWLTRVDSTTDGILSTTSNLLDRKWHRRSDKLDRSSNIIYSTTEPTTETVIGDSL